MKSSTPSSKKKLQQLEEWFQSNGVEYDKNLICLKENVRGSGNGYGVIAVCDLEKDQEGTFPFTPSSSPSSFSNK